MYSYFGKQLGQQPDSTSGAISSGAGPTTDPIQLKPLAKTQANSDFSKRPFKNTPDTPYKLNISDQEVEKRVYSNVGTGAAPAADDTSADLESVIKTPDGLEVPAYIYKRSLERQSIDDAKKEAEDEIRGSISFRAGEYVSKNPMECALIAAGVGAIIAEIFF